jgi:hypothetical protein
MKFLEEKRELGEKYNKERIEYRLEMDEDMSRREKILRVEMDRKERDVKLLSQSINYVIEKYKKYEEFINNKYKERTKNEIKFIKDGKEEKN